jgi:hypothetical protein
MRKQNNIFSLKKTSPDRSLTNRPIDMSHVKSTINIWNDQYQPSSTKKQQIISVNLPFFSKTFLLSNLAI